MEDHIVRLENVTKTYEDGFTVLDRINLSVKHNEFLSFFIVDYGRIQYATFLPLIGGIGR